MTAGDLPVDLHDPAALIAADTAALLPAAALAGAQVRATADQLAGRPPVERPRALVVVGAGAAAEAALLVALIGEQAQTPIVAAAGLPAWVGPLDVVVVFAAAFDDPLAARAAAVAARRGAAVVVRASTQGSVADAAQGNLIDPRVSVTEALCGPARLTVLAGIAADAGLYPRPDFDAVAELLDAMALACHPASEFFVNPALTLAEHLLTGVPLLIGMDPIADAMTAYGCRSLAALAGLAAAGLTAGEAAGSPSVLARSGSGDARAGVFYDPFVEEAGASTPPITAVLLSGPPTDLMAERSRLSAALEAALPRAIRVGQEEPPGAGAPAPASRALEQVERDNFAATVLLMSRIDFAAVYAGLATGARPPADVPDGLGLPGRSVQHLPSSIAAAAWSETETDPWS